MHGAYVADHEVHRVVTDWKQRAQPEYIEHILSGEFDKGEYILLPGETDPSEEVLDALYDEAVAFVTETRRGSISSVQRKFKIGYSQSRAQISGMELAYGIVMPMNNGNREVLAPACASLMCNKGKFSELSMARIGHLSASALADTKSEQALQQKLAKQQSMVAKFQQKVVDKSDTGSYYDQSWSICLCGTAKVFWHAQDPESKIVADGQDLYFYDVDLEQVRIASLEDSVKTPMVLLMQQHDPVVQQQYEITTHQDCFRLTPKAESRQNSMAKHLDLCFDQQHRLTRLETVDVQHTKSTFTFSLTKRVLTPGNYRFQFKMPKGVQVRDERRSKQPKK